MGFGDKFLVLRCTAEKISYLPRPAPRQGTLTGLDLRLRLRLRSPKCFGHVPTSRVAGWNDFLQGLASLISPREEPGFEAFPAVYRAPSLFWHRPGYEFPGVHGRPCHPKATDAFTIPYLAFHAPVGLPTGLRLSPGASTLPRGGFSGPRIAVGAEILRFTAAFLLGLGFFSLSDLAIHPIFFSRFHRATVRIPLGASAFAAAPFLRYPLALRWRRSQFRCFQSLSGGAVFPRRGLPSALGRLPLASNQVLPSALFVLVYQWEAGFLQGITLRRGVPPSQEAFDGIASTSRSRARGRILGGAFDEVRLASLADVPFSRLSASPFLSSFTSRQGRSAVAFSVLRGEPLGKASSRFRFRSRFLLSLPHFPVYRLAGGSLAGPRLGQGLPYLFRGSRPFRKRVSLGASCVPHTLPLVMWFPSFGPPCGLPFPAEHITIRASKNPSTLFCKIFETFFVDTFRYLNIQTFLFFFFMDRKTRLNGP